MRSSPYFRHALYSLVCLSISINYVSLKRVAEEEKSRMNARISILQSIKDHLRTRDRHDPVAEEELARLTRLSQKVHTVEQGSIKDEITWTQIFTGMPVAKGGAEDEMTAWEKEDLAKIEKELRQ